RNRRLRGHQPEPADRVGHQEGRLQLKPGHGVGGPEGRVSAGWLQRSVRRRADHLPGRSGQRDLLPKRLLFRRRLMLPQQTLFAREIGDTQSPYWTAATLDGLKLLLEPGESLLRVCYCRVSKLGPNAWTLENPTTVVVTDRRTAFLTTQFDKG